MTERISPLTYFWPFTIKEDLDMARQWQYRVYQARILNFPFPFHIAASIFHTCHFLITHSFRLEAGPLLALDQDIEFPAYTVRLLWPKKKTSPL